MKNHKLPSRLLALALCLCMVLSLMPMMPLVAEAATVPNYISSIGISQDGSSGSTGVNDCKRELAGHTIIDVDLNDEAGGDYVYMGYKTTTDPAQAITGIVFRVGKNPPNSISYGGSTFYLVGGSTEANTAQLGGYIDLNARAGGYYIYTYVTRDPNYGAPLTNLTVNRSSSYSGWYVGTDTNGNVMDLNDDASNYYLYLHYQRFSGKASSTFYYLTSGGSRTSSTTSVSVKNHTQSVSTTPSVPSTVTYDGRTFTFRGWREDNTASSSTVSPSYSYMTSKTYRAVYSATVALSYNANGGSGAPSRQTATQYINAGSSSVSKTSHSFTISATKPTHDDSKCVFLGWSTGSSAISASHQPRQTITISSNTTLYAVWRSAHTANRTYVNNGADHTYTWPCCGKSVTEAHSYTDGFCVCGAMIPDAVATVSKNGKVVAAYTILNDAIQAVQDCTAADEAVITILKGIALGDNYQTISSGVFTIDLNGFEISSTNSDYGALYVYGAAVTIRDSGEDGKITGKRAGIEVFDGELTVLDGTVSGGSSRNNCGVYAAGSSTVTISGGTISGYYAVCAEASGVTISGGTVSGETAGVYTDGSNVTISSGSISGYYGVAATFGGGVIISGGTISGERYGVYADGSTATISGGSISGGNYDIRNYNSTIALTLGDDGVGARFPGGITVLDTTLNEILGEGAAYWQGNNMILPADDATEITGGDVVIKSTCPHASKSNYTDLKDGASHTYFCSDCNNTFTESHSYTNLLCVCGAAHSDAVASVSKNGKVVAAYATLNDAIQAVQNCTAADKAVVTILQDIALGNSIQGIYSGVFTIDLNGHEISSTNASWGTLYIHGSAPNVTIQGTGENSKITGNYAGIEISYGVNLTIAGGTISGDWYGVYADGSNVTISGGSISSNTFDIACYSSTVALTVDEDGVGARFPGGIEVRVTTLNAVLGEGAAYWQGNTMILPADDATVITGGDVVIKAECKHPGDKTYTNNGDDHSYTYSCCNNTVTEGHSYSNGLCVCGAMVSDAVASVSKNGIVTGAYTTLNDAIQAVRNCTAADKAVVTILQDIALGDSYQEISSGVFTIDLNSKTLSGTNSTYGVLYLNGFSVNVTVTDSGTGGTISGYYGVIATLNSRVTISGGTISAEQSGVVAQDLSSVTISGGTISGYYGVAASFGGVTIIGGTISGERYGVYADGGNVVIRGGSISGDTYDIISSLSTMILTLGENGVGATFPGGITVDGTTLNEILDEGAAYWQGNTMIIPANNATEIPGGDVVIKAECKHPGDKTYTNNGDDHSYTYSCCNNTVTESHSYTNGLCACGAVHPDMVASVSKNGIVTGAYTTLNGAIQAVKDCTAADKAVVTILKDIALGDRYQKTYSGEFTIDLNGHEISNTNTFWAALYIASDAAKVTIQGAGENSKIIGEYAGITVDTDAMLTITGGSISGVECGVETSSSIVTISGGTIRGDRNGVRADGSTVTITDGTISGGYEGVYAYNNSTVTISGGTISGGYDGVYAYNNSTVTISGGTISSEEDGVHASNSTVTITDGAISGVYEGVYASRSTVTITGGTISGDDDSVYVTGGSTVTITGGTISGDYSVYVTGGSTVTITGGTISGVYEGVHAYNNSIVTISGGSISGDFCDIYNSFSTVTLTLGEDGVGATFPGGITVGGTTLNAILGEGAAYWQGDKQMNPADDATEIPGGDVVIKAACKHSGDKTYTNNGDDHTYTCSVCDATVTEGHTYIDGVCVCGVADVNVAVASTTVGGITTYYGTLGSAIQAVKDCTAADKAVVTILKDIALGDNYQTISSGVFTIDLNGHEISSTNSAMGVLYLRTDAVNVTIQGAGENSKITGSYDGIELYSATLTINGGTISGGNHAVRTSRGTVTISGGRISGGVYDIVNSDSTITLTLGENGVGATFPGGISVDGTTLNDILGEDAVYCQGNAMVIPADDATEISRGDVVIKAFCDHSGNVNVDDNDCSTHLVCSVCNLVISYSSDHDYDDNGFCVNCGDYQPAVLKDGWYQITNGGNLFWFAQLVNNRTSDANAVLTNDVDLENRDWIPMGNAIAYEGIIDGAGYTVSGLKVSGNRQYSGFIGQLSNGGVKNLTLSGTVDATCGSSGYVGLMVGHMTDSALYNCSVSGSVKALAHAFLYMGGLVGSANHCVIINCSSEADVTLLRGYSDETAYVGGLAGEVKVGNEEPVCLLNSYAVGNITVGTEENPWSGTVHAGGIVGYLRDDAVNNYFYGDIDVHCDGTSNVGYAFGYVQGYSYLVNAGSEDAPTELIISNNYYPEGKTAVGAGKIYVDGAGQSGIDESWTTAVSEANIKATSGENALVYILNSNVPYVERIIEEHLGFLNESEWAAIVENIGGKNFAAQKWVVKNGHPVHDKYSGWTEIDGDWYYYDPETGKPVTGITRVPYPAEVINGVTYAPNMEDVKYANDKGTLFKDSISAFFVFDENGVFQSGLNGMTSDNRWAVNGCIVWHVGLVQVGEDYYYFIGDVDNGGNKMATGDVYVSRNTTDFDMVPGGVYTFGEDGKLCKNEGIVDLRYYENYRLMLGNGLTKVGENYIYVNSKGELIVDAEYYVPGNDLGIASGLYYFDENGYLVEHVSTDKDGVYFENGAWYYYVDGKIAYNQGLISVNTTWYGADGSENVYSGYIYVRSSGKLAIGEYYITNVSNDASGLFSMGMKVLFDENGIADAPKNGIYEIDGELYYFVKNQIQYNAGLIELGGGWIYVRSSGKLAVGDYWITNTNGAMDQGMYEFGENGYMVIVDIEDGIVSDNGVLYYYLDGKKQYGLGLRQLSDGSYIYVRTNGQLAVGSYWITNHNGLLPEGLYTFGDDGILVKN